MTLSLIDLPTLFRSAKFSEIVELCQKFNVNSQSHPIEAKFLAGAYFSLSDYSSAYSLLSELHTLFLNDVELLSLFGATCRRMGKFSQAKELFSSAISISPSNPELINNYTNLLIDLGELVEAKRLLSDLVRSNPEYIDARENLTRVDYLISNPPTVPASDVDQVSVTASSTNNSPIDPLSLAFSIDESKDSKSQVLSTLSKSSLSSLSAIPEVSHEELLSDQYSFCDHLILEKNYSDCLIHLDNLLSKSSSPSRLYKLASDCYLGLNRLMEAELSLLIAASLDSSIPDYFINLSSFALLRSDFSTAKYNLAKASSLGANAKALAQLEKSISAKANSSQSANHFNFVQGWSSLSKLSQKS